MREGSARPAGVLARWRSTMHSTVYYGFHRQRRLVSVAFAQSLGFNPRLPVTRACGGEHSVKGASSNVDHKPGQRAFIDRTDMECASSGAVCGICDEQTAKGGLPAAARLGTRGRLPLATTRRCNAQSALITVGSERPPDHAKGGRYRRLHFVIPAKNAQGRTPAKSRTRPQMLVVAAIAR